MFGTFVNTLAIIAGGLVGLIFKGGIPEKYRLTIMQAVSLAVILVGLKSALRTDALLTVIFSLAIGSVIGEWARIEERLEGLGKWFEHRLSGLASGVSKGFVTASLVFCVGSMAIVGSLESGLTGIHQTLFAKSLLDGISSVIFASTLGAGVLLSAAAVFVYQGFITLTASFMKQFLVTDVITQMASVGGLLIMAIGYNLLELKKIKVGNMLPAIFVPLVYYMIRRLWF